MAQQTKPKRGEGRPRYVVVTKNTGQPRKAALSETVASQRPRFVEENGEQPNSAPTAEEVLLLVSLAALAALILVAVLRHVTTVGIGCR